jgi:hypothetical protein
LCCSKDTAPVIVSMGPTLHCSLSLVVLRTYQQIVPYIYVSHLLSVDVITIPVHRAMLIQSSGPKRFQILFIVCRFNELNSQGRIMFALFTSSRSSLL